MDEFEPDARKFLADMKAEGIEAVWREGFGFWMENRTWTMEETKIESSLTRKVMIWCNDTYPITPNYRRIAELAIQFVQFPHASNLSH